MEDKVPKIEEMPPNFSIKSILNDFRDDGNYFEGYVHTMDQVTDVLRQFSLATGTRYTVIKACRSFGTDLTSAELQNVHAAVDEVAGIKSKTKGNFYPGKLRCLWTSQREPLIKFDGMPFIVRGTKLLECRCVTGPYRSYGTKKEVSSEPGPKRRKLEKDAATSSQTCPARIRIKEIFRFPEFFIEQGLNEGKKHFERVSKRRKLDELKEVCACTGTLPLVERRFYLVLPKPEGHNHETVITGNSSLTTYIAKLQEEDLDSKYYLYGNSDAALQENLAVKSIENRSTESDENSMQEAESVENSDSSEPFIFVHQTPWQQELLRNYGNELSVLNPMTERRHYCLPLYFIFVKTDLGYTSVATFIVQKETKEIISSALRVLREWNPEWKPQYWVTVLTQSVAEIAALEENFPGSKVYLCPFSVETAFHRWITVGRYKLDPSEQEEVEAMLLRIKNAGDEAALLEAQKNLEDSQVWKKNQYLQNWFCDKWLPFIEKWAYYYWQSDGGFKFVSSVNMCVPLTKMNIVYSNTKHNPERTMRGVISQVVKSYLPMIHSRFVRNFQRQQGAYTTPLKRKLPSFLYNRPHQFLKHCVDVLANVNRCAEVVKHPSEPCTFTVSNLLDTTTCQFVSSDGMPHCDCESWAKTYWPCLHFLTVIQLNHATWNDFPARYTQSPFFKVMPCSKSFAADFIKTEISSEENCCSLKTETALQPEVEVGNSLDEEVIIEVVIGDSDGTSAEYYDAGYVYAHVQDEDGQVIVDQTVPDVRTVVVPAAEIVQTPVEIEEAVLQPGVDLLAATALTILDNQEFTAANCVPAREVVVETVNNPADALSVANILQSNLDVVEMSTESPEEKVFEIPEQNKADLSSRDSCVPDSVENILSPVVGAKLNSDENAKSESVVGEHNLSNSSSAQGSSVANGGTCSSVAAAEPTLSILVANSAQAPSVASGGTHSSVATSEPTLSMLAASSAQDSSVASVCSVAGEHTLNNIVSSNVPCDSVSLDSMPESVATGSPDSETLVTHKGLTGGGSGPSIPFPVSGNTELDEERQRIQEILQSLEDLIPNLDEQLLEALTSDLRTIYKNTLKSVNEQK